MLPPRVAETFARLPDELIDLCRPHSWKQLITPPAKDLRSIRDIFAHLIGAEGFWIGHVIKGKPRLRTTARVFKDLDSILARWKSQREATLELLTGLTIKMRVSRRPIPWDPSGSATVEEIVWHVVTHEHYHRGQISTRLGLLGRRDLPDYDILRYEAYASR